MRVWLNGIVSDMVRIRQGRVIGWVSTARADDIRPYGWLCVWYVTVG